MNEEKRPGSLFFPLLLVCAGVLILLINLGTLSGTVWQNLAQYWPIILIIAGLDGLYKRDGWVGPLVLLGLGTVLLLGNLNYLDSSGFNLLVKLWPILLVAIGLDVMLGHRGSIWSNLIRVFLGLALVAGIVWLAAASPFFSMGMKTVPYQQALDKATSSEMRFAIGAGELYLSGGADEDMLIEGSAGLPKEMTLDPEYTAPKNGLSRLTLEGSSIVILPVNTPFSPWNFDFNSEIPIELTAKLGAGEMRIDLSDTQVQTIDIELGVGEALITLPSDVDVEGEISGAVGELVIRVPKGAEVLIQADRALVGTTLPNGYTVDDGTIRSPKAEAGAQKITLNVDLAVGSLVIKEMN